MASPSPSPSPSNPPYNGEALTSCVKEFGRILGDIQGAIVHLHGVIDTIAEPSSDKASPVVAPDTAARVVMSSRNSNFNINRGCADSDDESMSSSRFDFELPRADPNADKWYSVTVGRLPGVFLGPSDVTPNINKIPGGHATKHKTQTEALDVFFKALDDGMVERVQVSVVRDVLTRNDTSRYQLPDSDA